MPKPKKVGRPKLPKGEAMGRIVPVRFAGSDIRTIARLAKGSGQNVSEWIRGAVMGRNLLMWFAQCPDDLHIPLFEQQPADYGYCYGCGGQRPLHRIGKGYVSFEERDKGLADSTPLGKPDSTPPPDRL